MDPSLQIDVLTEFQQWDDARTGVLLVQGQHNGSKAFLFQGTIWLLAVTGLAPWRGSARPPEPFPNLLASAFALTLALT